MSVASSRAGKCQLRAVEVASRLSTAMTQWQRFGSERQMQQRLVLTEGN